MPHTWIDCLIAKSQLRAAFRVSPSNINTATKDGELSEFNWHNSQERTKIYSRILYLVLVKVRMLFILCSERNQERDQEWGRHQKREMLQARELSTQRQRGRHTRGKTEILGETYIRKKMYSPLKRKLLFGLIDNYILFLNSRLVSLKSPLMYSKVYCMF